MSDDEYATVWTCAHPTAQDAMDLACIPADVLKFNVTDIADGSLSLTQNKMGKKLRVAIEGRTYGSDRQDFGEATKQGK